MESAETYYRIMYFGGPESWNLRDTHMFETLEHLLEVGGPDARAVVWAHNSRIGDARATDMGAVRGAEHRPALPRAVGRRGGADRVRHPCRHRRGGDRLGRRDGGQARPPLARGQLRAALPRVGRGALDMRHDEGLRRRLMDERLERFIGVIYRPETELMSHYATLPQQFDA